jgi:hypothetical protein
MSYEFYITRADGWSDMERWSENQSNPITFEEWERLAKDDPELAIDYAGRLSEEELDRILDSHPEFAGCRTKSLGIRFSREQDQLLRQLARDRKAGETPDPDDFDLGYDTADWIAHPEGERRCFWFHRGAISTKNPDMATLDKMLQLSKRLNACVRGDDEEIYRRTDRGFDCYRPDRGWLPLERFHQRRPDWAPAIIREIAKKRSKLS